MFNHRIKRIFKYDKYFINIYKWNIFEKSLVQNISSAKSENVRECHQLFYSRLSTWNVNVILNDSEVTLTFERKQVD